MKIVNPYLRELLILIAIVVSPSVIGQKVNERPNILMICIDDMNDWVGFLGGHEQAKTPHMDKLASQGVNFTNAHCVSPACSPSRNAILLGAEPFKTGLYPFYDLNKVEPEVLEPYTALPELLRRNGYKTYGISKVFHKPDTTLQDRANWNEYTKYGDSWIKGKQGKGHMSDSKDKYLSVSAGVNPLEDFGDVKSAMHAVEYLKRSHLDPFFLAVGFKKPHVPFVMPEENYDRFKRTVSPPVIEENDLEDIPPVGLSMVLQDRFNKLDEHDCWNEVRKGYLASISFTDDNVGRVLKALNESAYAENTIVILWSDHGFHLGEKGTYTKFTLWEESTRVPFIIWDPRDRVGNGAEVSEAVSLINIYKTICDLTGITPPTYVDGMSLVPWLDNPEKAKKKPALTTWGRGNYSLRTKKWRYTRYYDGTEELYDHAIDPNEWVNLADDPQYDELKKEFVLNWLPKSEASLVTSGIVLHNVRDADKPLKTKWKTRIVKIMFMVSGSILIVGAIILFFRKRTGKLKA